MNEYLYKAFEKYFSALENVGYYKREDVEKLLMLMFLNKMVCDSSY